MRSVRLIGGCVAFAALLTGVARQLPLVASERPLLTLNVRMTEMQALSMGARAALRHEAEAIWEDGHIRLRWINRDVDGDGGPLLRVLVIPRAHEAAARTTWPVGELLRREDGDPIAIASVTGARRILDQTRFQLMDHPTVHDRRLGVVLGRALAHEIGHFLLHTNTHATRGLMRASIDAAEFADLRSGAFRLDQAARAHLAALAARSVVPLDLASTAFSYSSE